jgi:Dynamin central region
MYACTLHYNNCKQHTQSFFAVHPHFKGCDPKLFGVDNLTSRLTRLLVSRIQAELSPMKAEVEAALGAVRAELKGLSGYGAATGPADRQKLLVTVTQATLVCNASLKTGFESLL